MEQFRTVLSSRLKNLMVLNGVFSLAVVLLALNGSRIEEETGDFVHGMQLGLFIGIQIMILFIGSKWRQALRSQEALKSFYIAETDERRKLIQQMSAAAALNIGMYVLAMAAVASGFFQRDVSITLFLATLAITVIRAVSKQYYSRKF